MVPTRVFQRRQAKLTGHQQTGQLLPTKTLRARVHAACCNSDHRQALGLSSWLAQLLARKHQNVVIVALANKLVRMAWAVLCKGGTLSRSRPCGVHLKSRFRKTVPSRFACGERWQWVDPTLSEPALGKGPNQTVQFIGTKASGCPSRPGVIDSTKGRIHWRRPTAKLIFRLQLGGGPYIPRRSQATAEFRGLRSALVCQSSQLVVLLVLMAPHAP